MESSPRATASWASALFRSLYLLACIHATLAANTVSPLARPPSASANVVHSNFFGISLELSFINYYFGNTTAQIPQPFVQYLTTLNNHASKRPVRLRLGGNSMDDSTYVPNQASIIQFTNPNANSNDQPVNFGPQLFDVMKGVSTAVGGAQYLIGLSLRTPNNTNIPLLAGDASKALGDDLDAFLLGNEPDLYTSHGQRPGLSNYTVQDYTGDYSVVFNNLKNTSQGDVLSLDNIGGPTICCSWDLASVLQSGWLSQYSAQLKYITLQHYPQNDCGGKPSLGLDYYVVHANTVNLALWQQHGIQIAAQNNKSVLMDEFNSVSCGGVEGISDTFGATLWTTDYALQLAAVGYSGAYIHTREPGVTYNLFDPPAIAGSAGPWTTNPTFYGMLPVSEALGSTNGSRVLDLDVQNSMSDKNATVAGYAIYDGIENTVHSLVLFNYANVSGATSDYAIDKAFIPTYNTTVTIRYLTAPSIDEKTNITWGGLTYAGVGDANAVSATFSTSIPDKSVSCAGGCTVQIPGPGLAVVFLGQHPNNSNNSNNNSSSSSNQASPATISQLPPLGNGGGRTASGVSAFELFGTLFVALASAVLAS